MRKAKILVGIPMTTCDGAKWKPRETPADPFAETQPDNTSLGTALPPDELDDLETIITSGKGQAGVPRDVATSVGDHCAQCVYDCMELPAIVKDGHWQCQRYAHWYPVRVKAWLDAIKECQQERRERAEHETPAPQPDEIERLTTALRRAESERDAQHEQVLRLTGERDELRRRVAELEFPFLRRGGK